MSVTIIQRAPTRECQRGHCRPLPRPNLDVPGRLYVGHIMTIYGISHSCVYAHIQKQILPPPDGVAGVRKYWRTATIKAHLET